MKRKAQLLAALGLALLIVGGAAALAQRQGSSAERGRPEVKVQLAGAVERNERLLAVGQAGLVNPGEVVRWTINSHNQGTAAARDYQTVGLIPPGTSFVAGSASADGATVVYSVDGGQSFSAEPTVEQRQSDGSVKRVPAPPSRYTHVRYEWAAPLEAGAQLTASYQVRVK
jgi:uncharacterized repeat protein (TIGR01451 family)